MEQKFLAISLNGKKSEFYFENGHVFFMSHVGKWDKSNDRQPEKRHSWKSACYLGTWDADPNDFNIDNVRGAFSDVLTATTGTINTLTPWDGPKFTRTNNDPPPTPSADPSAPANDPTPTADPVAPTTATTTPTPSADPLAVLRQLLGGGTDPNTANEVAQLKQLVRILTDGLNTTRSELADVLTELASIKDRQPVTYNYNVTSSRGTHTITTPNKCHKEFKTVVKLVENNIPVYLYGPAGSGKSELVKQVAKALGLAFYYTGSVSQEYKLTGFKDASGTFQETDFFRAVTGGGVFFADEFDGSAPDVALLFNAVLANGICEFAGTTYEVHPDFRFIAAGNTTGLGQTDEYTGRYQLDAATLDRFAVVTIDYDPDLEESFANGDTEITDFVRELRKAVKSTRIKSLPLGYRSIIRLAQLTPEFGVKKALEMSIIKGMENEDVRMLSRGLGRLYNNKFACELAKY